MTVFEQAIQEAIGDRIPFATDAKGKMDYFVYLDVKQAPSAQELADQIIKNIADTEKRDSIKLAQIKHVTEKTLSNGHETVYAIFQPI